MPVSLANFPKLTLPAADGVDTILCGQEKKNGYLFAVLKLKSGALCAAWDGHHHICDDEASLMVVLNSHEKAIYKMGANF